jgi:hypothetical protein
LLLMLPAAAADMLLAADTADRSRSAGSGGLALPSAAKGVQSGGPAMKGEDLVWLSAELLREGALVGEPDPVGLLLPLPPLLLDKLGAKLLFVVLAGA